MHIHEIFKAIYENHFYEYLVIDRDHNVIEYSDKVFELSHTDKIDCCNTRLTDVVPEFVGNEDEIERIFKEESEKFTLPYVFREPDQYVHIHVHPGRKYEDDGNYHSATYETVIILFENISQMAVAQQALVQERNEKSLLLDDISQKNLQLKHLNEQMQMLIQREIEKNIEKQKLLELKSRHSQMGEMIAMITHQWKQPLNVINLIVNILKIDLNKKSLPKEKIEKKLNDILKQVSYMNQTVNDFQNFFNPFKEMVIFNVNENIQSVLDLVQYEYDHKNIALELTGKENVMAYGFPNEFNQVVLSILKNAKDAFLERPHNHMKITINITKEEDAPVVSITDNAGGIPEDILPRVFDLYVTTKDEGYGLGLNIAKSMIEKHMGGKITAENVEDGARFTIKLPAPPPTLENGMSL